MKRLAMLAAVVIFATGCAAPAATTPATTAAPEPATQSAPEVTPTPVVLGPGEYTWENATGAKGTMSIPGKPDPEIERLRTLAGGKPTTYITVKVDNRQGSVGVNMYGISIFTPEGEELEYRNADEYISSLRPDDAPAEVYNQFIEAGNKHMAMANPKAVKTFVMTGPALPETFTGVTVYPTGTSDPVDALPAP